MIRSGFIYYYFIFSESVDNNKNKKLTFVVFAYSIQRLVVWGGAAITPHPLQNSCTPLILLVGETKPPCQLFLGAAKLIGSHLEQIVLFLFSTGAKKKFKQNFKFLSLFFVPMLIYLQVELIRLQKKYNLQKLEKIMTKHKK